MSNSEKKLPGWKELPIGAMIIKPGSALDYNTGDWRSEKPVHDPKICIHCMQCWAYCPDTAILVKDGQMLGFDMMHCKGCGICAKICPTKPVKAIKMETEKK